MSRNIAMNKFSVKEQQVIVDICVQVHQRYESFATLLMSEIEK